MPLRPGKIHAAVIIGGSLFGSWHAEFASDPGGIGYDEVVDAFD